MTTVVSMMPRVWWPWLTARTWMTALLSLHLLLPVSAIKCMQCTSMMDMKCESGDLSATECPKENSRYCIKYTGDDSFVFRGCSDKVNSQCEMRDLEGSRIHVCYHTCDTDGCNAAMKMSSLPVAILLSVAFIVVSFTSSFVIVSSGV